MTKPITTHDVRIISITKALIAQQSARCILQFLRNSSSTDPLRSLCRTKSLAQVPTKDYHVPWPCISRLHRSYICLTIPRLVKVFNLSCAHLCSRGPSDSGYNFATSLHVFRVAAQLQRHLISPVLPGNVPTEESFGSR